jgi:hypothetical protein
MASIPAAANVTAMTGLRLGGGRGQRARFPNANSETDQFPVGWVKVSTTLSDPNSNEVQGCGADTRWGWGGRAARTAWAGPP